MSQTRREILSNSRARQVASRHLSDRRPTREPVQFHLTRRGAQKVLPRQARQGATDRAGEWASGCDKRVDPHNLAIRFPGGLHHQYVQI